MSFPKPKTYRNKNYLDWVKTQNCIICNAPADDAHHVRRIMWGAGMGHRPHDYVAIPVCRKHHNPVIEELVDVKDVIIDLLMKYIAHCLIKSSQTNNNK